MLLTRSSTLPVYNDQIQGVGEMATAEYKLKFVADVNST